MSKMSELDADRQQIERLTDVVPPPSFAESARAGVPVIAPTPWELVEATEHHGPYIVNAYGADVCDLYAMSNPTAASVRNGGNSFPLHFADAAANAAFIVKAVNRHDALVKALEFYADPFAWKQKHDPEDVVRIPDFYSETSFGDTAQEALAALAKTGAA